MWIVTDHLLCIEVRYSFTADCSCKHVLMCVDECVDTGLSELVDQLFDLVEVVIVIHTFFSFDGFPHHSETNKVLSPFDKISDVLVIK